MSISRPSTPVRGVAPSALVLRVVLLALALSATVAGARPGAAFAAPERPASGERPLLVTVDDLPLAGGRLHEGSGERAKITGALLDALARHGIRALAFVIWDNVRTDADRALLRRWLDAGHELGNHSASHLDYTKTEIEPYIADVERGRAGLAGFLGESGKTGPRFFRFPFLNEGNTPLKLAAMRAYLARSGQRNAHVTIDVQDWALEEPWVAARKTGDKAAQDEIRADYLAMLRAMVQHHEINGDGLFDRTTPQVLLLHANEVGAANWDALFAWLRATGHRFAVADEVFSDPVFREEPEFVATQGVSLWDRIGDERARARVAGDLKTLLARQADAWNVGDLDAFCSVYADDALFVTPGGLTRGRAAVLERYRARYPTKEAMGTLSFTFEDVRAVAGLEVSVFGDSVPGRPHAATAVARWSLRYPDKPEASGWTLLTFERRGRSWVITRDASM